MRLLAAEPGAFALRKVLRVEVHVLRWKGQLGWLISRP
jgi:hypothetical protein